MTDNDDGADRRLSRRAILLGAFTLPLVLLEPEPASAQLGLIGAMLGGFRFRFHRRHYGGYHRARSHYARHRGRVHVANRHRHAAGVVAAAARVAVVLAAADNSAKAAFNAGRVAA